MITQAEVASAGNFAALNRGGSLRDSAEQALSAAIITGDLAPGTLVTVPRLAKQFNVSATPVREAMLDLEKRGFLESVRNKGFLVTDVSEDDLRSIVEVRRLLEVPALRMVVDDFPVDRLAEFEAHAREITAAAECGQFADYLAADWVFHRALLELTGHRRLVALVGDLRRETRMVGLANLRGTEELRTSALEHGQLLELIVAGRTDDACALLDAHIGHVLGWWAGRGETAPTA